MALTLLPVAGKQKSVDICKAFAAGAPKGASGVVFFGVNDSNVTEFRRVRREGVDWYYIDNAYFDRHRGVYFRVAKNALQCRGDENSDGARFAALGVEIKPWRDGDAGDILITPQSDSFMRTAAGYRGSWVEAVMLSLSLIQPWIDSQIVRVRPWTPDKIKAATTLLEDLKRVRLLITHSSASAITAMMEGVPAISMAGAANRLTGTLSRASALDPPRPAGRLEFAQALADNQFTLDEFRRGVAWRHLNP